MKLHLNQLLPPNDQYIKLIRDSPTVWPHGPFFPVSSCLGTTQMSTLQITTLFCLKLLVIIFLFNLNQYLF